MTAVVAPLGAGTGVLNHSKRLDDKFDIFLLDLGVLVKGFEFSFCL